jgi:ATP-dependent RNA helicase SUPV3L1/SUV3
MTIRTLPRQARNAGVTAVLGPTNTGKTHYALERMTAHATGMIGLPLRLLAREVYQRLVEKVGAASVALVTGEEKIKPERPRFWVSTVEAMPRDLVTDFVAIDEVQLAADPDRGHVFTDRLLNQRGRSETLLIGAGTMRPLIEKLMPGVNVVSRPRLSNLAFAGDKKITRLPPRAAIVAFSADEVYAVAELIRRQKGGAAVVLGSLSPRTRNAQVDLYQNGEVDYLVATDAIGMGLNLDVDHVAFASDRKFDGHRFRRLHPAEFGQIAGRAGRHMRDGSFGSSGRCPPLDDELVEAIENHRFDPVTQLHWRNRELSFGSIAALKASLAVQPDEDGLTRAAAADDVTALEIVSADADIRRFASGAEAVERLWEACQVPDYRKVSAGVHAELVAQLYRGLMEKGRIPPDWFKRQVEPLDRTDGDIDTLSNRIAQIRTWTFVANRPDWLADPEHWQAVTRQVEDKLSDALHERLAARFVDRRTSVLLRRLRENTMLEAQVATTGDVAVEGQHVGTLLGFQFLPDARASGPEARALNAAALKALASELEARAARLSLAGDESFVLSNDGLIRWQGEPVAKLAASEKILAPRVRLLADDQLGAAAREQIEQRLNLWLKAHITRHLGPLLMLEDAPDLTGIARGIGFQVAEALGVLDRARVAGDVKQLEQDARAALRKHGVRFGAHHIYMPALLKPAPRSLASQLWALTQPDLDPKTRDDIAHLTHSGRTSIPADASAPKDLYRVAGFRVAGERALRVDILERLADLIRPAIAYRPGVTQGEPPPGAADGDGFVITGAMTSLVGASGPDFAGVLKALGYQVQSRPGPAITVPLAARPAPAAAVAPAEAGSPAEAPDEDLSAADAAAVEPAASEPADVEASAVETPAVETPGAEGQAPEGASPDIAPQDIAPPDVLASGDVAQEATAPPETLAAEPIAEPAAIVDVALTDADAAVPAPPPAPEMIEVWRVVRHGAGRRDQRDGRGRGRGPRAEGVPGVSQDGAPQERAPRKPWRGRPDNRPDARPGARPDMRSAPRAGDAAAPQAPREGARPETRPEMRGDARPDRRPEGVKGGKPFRPPGVEGRRGDERDERSRGPRRDGRPNKEERFDRSLLRDDRRPANREPDPNSPFAKLAALKAQLESGRK